MSRRLITILAVEDDPNIFEDLDKMLDKFFNALHDDFPYNFEILFTDNLRDATNDLQKATWVITDVCFAEVPNGDATQPYGMQIVRKCVCLRKPVVWVTSTLRHGLLTNAANDWGREHGIEMFVCPQNELVDDEAPHKPWKEAFFGLIITAIGLELGEVVYHSDGVIRKKDGNKGFVLFSKQCKTMTDRWLDTKTTVDFLRREPILARMLDMGFPRQLS